MLESMTVAQQGIIVAFFIAALMASHRLQFQSLMYLLAIIFASSNYATWLLITFLYIVSLMYNLQTQVAK